MQKADHSKMVCRWLPTRASAAEASVSGPLPAVAGMELRSTPKSVSSVGARQASSVIATRGQGNPKAQVRLLV